MKQNNLEDYYFVVRQYDIEEGFGENVYRKEVLGIGLYDSKLDIVYPLPITKFLESYRKKSGSLSSQRNPAEAVKRFLNYCRYTNLKSWALTYNLMNGSVKLNC